MKAREVRDLSADEQAQKLAELEKELFNLRIQQTAGQLEKPDRIRWSGARSRGSRRS
jgi:ribosomal protein L29